MKLASILLLALMAPAAQAQEGRVWTVETPKGLEARLSYGTPGTEDLVLALRCTPKSGQILLGASLGHRIETSIVSGRHVDVVGIPAPWPVSVHIASTPEASTLRGKADVDERRGGSFVLTEISSAAPVVKRFRKSGVIAVTAFDETIAPPPAAKRDVRKFLRVCK